jgi:hypothetical protein
LGAAAGFNANTVEGTKPPFSVASMALHRPSF